MSNQENISKETKKTRRKKSQRKAQQIKLAVIMIMVSVLVLSASTFAWYQLNNTANVTDMEFTAQTMGKLQISDAAENPGGTNADAYSNSLSLAGEVVNKILLPSTTPDGKEFYSPNYTIDGLKVEGVTKITATDELSKYVYKKEFYLLSGEHGTTDGKVYDLKLDAGKIVDDDQNSGTYFVAGDDEPYNAVNAVRISFVIGEGVNAPIKIYEPNYDIHNEDINDDDVDDVHLAEVDANVTGYGPEKYIAMQQKSDGTFETGTVAGRDVSTQLGTITEGTPLKVTMYVWFEGMDDDCVSEIALTQIIGQIQFRAEEQTN